MKTMQVQAVNSGERLGFPCQLFLQIVVCKTCSLHLEYLMFCPFDFSALLPVPDGLGVPSAHKP